MPMVEVSNGGTISDLVPSGYFNAYGSVVQSPWSSGSVRGVGVIAGVQNATRLTCSFNPHATLYKIKADGTVDVEYNNIAGAHTYDVTDYGIVYIYLVDGSNFTAVCTIS